MPAFRVSTGFHVKHRRPKAGDASPEGLLKVERREFRCLGVTCLGVWGLGFGVWGLGFRVQVFRVQVFRVQVFRCLGFRCLGV